MTAVFVAAPWALNSTVGVVLTVLSVVAYAAVWAVAKPIPQTTRQRFLLALLVVGVLLLAHTWQAHLSAKPAFLYAPDCDGLGYWLNPDCWFA